MKVKLQKVLNSSSLNIFLVNLLLVGIFLSSAMVETALVCISLIVLCRMFNSQRIAINQIDCYWSVWLAYTLGLCIGAIYWEYGFRFWLSFFEGYMLFKFISSKKWSHRENIFSWALCLITLLLLIEVVSQTYLGESLIRHRLIHHWIHGIRFTGPYMHPNTLGGMLVILIPITGSLLYSNRLSFFLKLILSLVILVQIGLLLGTFSRGAWVGLIIGLYIIAMVKDWKIFLILFLILLGLYFWNNQLFIDRFKDIINFNNASVQTRFDSWSIAWELFLTNPVFGIGLGQFKFITNHGYAHNSYLEFLTETGIIGMICWFSLIGVLLKPAYSVLKTSEPILLLGVIASIFGFLFHSLIDTNFHTLPLMISCWILLGILNQDDDEINK